MYSLHACPGGLLITGNKVMRKNYYFEFDMDSKGYANRKPEQYNALLSGIFNIYRVHALDNKPNFRIFSK